MAMHHKMVIPWENTFLPRESQSMNEKEDNGEILYMIDIFIVLSCLLLLIIISLFIFLICSLKSMIKQLKNKSCGCNSQCRSQLQLSPQAKVIEKQVQEEDKISIVSDDPHSFETKDIGVSRNVKENYTEPVYEEVKKLKRSCHSLDNGLSSEKEIIYWQITTNESAKFTPCTETFITRYM